MELLKMLQEIRNPILNVIFKIFTMFGEELFVTAVICILFWCISKKSAYIIAFSFFVSGLVIQGLKIVFRVERPWIKDKGIVPVEGAKTTATSYSFPSGHTQSATSLFTSAASIIREKWAMVVCSIIIAGVMISRMYLGVHTPLDVLVSFVLTFILTCCVCALYDKMEGSKKNVKKMIVLVMFGVCTLLAVYDLIIYKSGVVSYDNAADCFKSVGAGMGFSLGWYIETEYIKFHTEGKWWQQILKLVIGVAIALVIKEIPKAVFGPGIIVDVLRYFFTIIWVVVVYPSLFKKIIK